MKLTIPYDRSVVDVIAEHFGVSVDNVSSGGVTFNDGKGRWQQHLYDAGWEWAYIGTAFYDDEGGAVVELDDGY